MPLEEWMKLWMYIIPGCLVVLPSPAGTARPRFDSSTDMGLVLVPADAEIDSVIFRLRATDQDADFPLIFDITATVTPIVRIENLPCTLYNKVCQANVILTRRLVPGRLHDFAVRVKDSKGDSSSMQATVSVTNATTQRDKIFPHIPAIIMVPEDSKPGKELDYVLVRSNQWSGKPVYIELWQPKELFTIRQRQTPAETRGVITLIGELDFETQSMYTLRMYATDPYTEPKKDTRNIAGLHLVVIVQDVQDVPPIFTLAPPLTKINNTIQPGDMVLRVHAEDGDKGVPREVTYGLVSEGNPFTPFFNISEMTGEITLARPLEELTQITHVGAPVVLSIVAEEIRRSTSEPPAQATVVEVGLLLGEPGNNAPFFENDNYIAWMDENAEPGSMVIFTEHYTTKVRDEDIGKAGVFALKLYNNNGTFEISPAVAERTANFIITVRDNSLIDYEMYKSLRFEIIAQEVGPATNLSTTVPATIFIRDVNDNPPEFESTSYEITLSEDVAAGTRVVQVHATDKDTGSFGRIQYTRIIGPGNEGFVIDPNTGIITVAMESMVLDRELTPSLQLSVEARDEDGKGLRGVVPLIVNILDVNDNAPIFEKDTYEFTLNEDSTNFTVPAIIKASDADAEPPNNEIRYELVHGNYENKFYLNELTGELFLRESINKIRRTRHNPYQNFATRVRNVFSNVQKTFDNMIPTSSPETQVSTSTENSTSDSGDKMDNVTSLKTGETGIIRKKRENDDVVFTLTARAYDLGVPHLSGVTRVNVMKGPVAGARIVSFVVPGENPDPAKTAETLAAITGGRITVQEIRPYTINDVPDAPGTNMPSLEGEKKSIVVARVEPNNGGTSLVDIERIRAALAANGVGVIGDGMPGMETGSQSKPIDGGTTSHNSNTNTNTITNITSVYSEEVTVYKAENRLFFWLLIILGLLMLLALIALIICCICPSCPFYMAPRKRRVGSSETLIARSDGRPKRNLHRKPPRLMEASWPGRKQAWSADPMRRNWQFNRRNQKAGGLASLPGDVNGLDREHEILEKTASLRLRDGPVTLYSTTEQLRRPEEERIYIEDVEGMRARGYVDVENFRRHDPERGLENPHLAYVNQDEQRLNDQPKFMREQHFYRDGNAEILRLVTRGQIEEGTMGHPARRPPTLVLGQGQLGAYRNDGKEILLQRFIEDQKNRHATIGQDLHDSFQDIERRSMESHQRQKEAVNNQPPPQQQQSQILLLPERLEEDHRQHIEELGPEVQRLIIDHGSFDKTGRYETKDRQELVEGATLSVHAPIIKVSSEKPKEYASRRNVNVPNYSIRDHELARQNALLTMLLLERDGIEVGGGALIDSASYLETQSLPGQVAIATQTDRTAATQTELPNRSRSDNDESEEEARMRKKLKSKKRYNDGEPRRTRTLWLKSPIKEEEMQYGTEKRTIFLRKKVRDVKDNRRISLEPVVLQEISDSLDENGEPSITSRRRGEREDSNLKEESRNEEESGILEESSSMEMMMRDGRRIVPVKRETKLLADDESKRKSHRTKHENIVEPSFRILEKEMSLLSKKLSRLAGKKILQYSNGSETDSQETIKAAAVTTDAKKIDKNMEIDEMKKVTKEADNAKMKRSKSTPRTIVSRIPLTKEQQTKIREENIDGKTRQTSKYRKGQTISTGSSDFEETMEKLKKIIPLVTHAERQRQGPNKSSYVKLKRHNRVEHREIAKSALVSSPQETGEGRDTSDTASKGSIKSCKSERDSMRMKRYSSGTVEGQSVLASGSASSDSLKDKRFQRKERSILDKKSVVETSEGKTESKHPSGVPSSDNLRDKRPQGKERPVLDRKYAVDRSGGKTQSEHASDGPSSDSLKDKTARGKERLILDRQSATEVSKQKTHSEVASDSPSSENLKDRTAQSKRIPNVERKSAVDHSEGKTESELYSQGPNTNNFKDEIFQKKEKPIPEIKSASEAIEEKIEPEPASDVPKPGIMKYKPAQSKERLILDGKNAVEASERKTDFEQASDSPNSDNLTDRTAQKKRKERPTLDRKSAVDHSEEKTEPDLNTKSPNTENLEDAILQKKERLIPDRKSTVENNEGKTESKQASSRSNSENMEDQTLQRRERLVLDRKSAAEARERKTEYEPASDGPNSDNAQDKILQRNETPILDSTISAKAIATSSKVSNEEMSRVSPTKSDEKIYLESTVSEIKRKSPEVPELQLDVVPVTVEMQSESTKRYDPNSDNSQNKILQRNETPIIDSKMSAKAIETSSKVSKEEISKVSPTKSDEKIYLESTVSEIKRKSPEVPEFELNIVPVTVEMQSESTERQHEAVIDEATGTQKSDDSKQENSNAIENKVLTMPKEEILDFLSHEVKDSTQALHGHYQSITERVEKIKDIILESVTMKKDDQESPGVSDKGNISEPIKVASSDRFKEWPEVPNDTSEKEQNIEKAKNVDEQSEDGGMFSDNFDSFCGTDINLKDSLSQDPKDEISYETLQSESSEEQIPTDKITDMKDEIDNSEKVANTDEPVEKSVSPQIITIEETPEAQKSISITPIPSQSTAGSPDRSPKRAVNLSPTPVAHELIITETSTTTNPDGSTHKSEIKLQTKITMKDPIDAPKDTTMEPTKSTKIEESDIKSVEEQIHQVPIVPILDIQTSDEQIVPIEEPKDSIETTKSPKVEQSEIKLIEEQLHQVPIVPALDIQTSDEQIVPIEEPKDIMEATKSPKVEQSEIKSVEEQLHQVPIVPALDIKTSDEKILPIEEPSEETHKIKSPKFPSKSPEKITVEIPSQKEFGIADSLFIDAKALSVPLSPKNVVRETNVEVSQEEMLGKEKMEIDVPPINLAELSRAMLEDADDSDSSEASSKTMLTARPYGTPRHRSISGSGDIKPAEVSLVLIETAPATGEAREAVQSPDKIGKEALPDKNTGKILIKPDHQMETKPDTSRQIAEETASAKKEQRPEVLPVEISSNTSNKESEIPIQIRDEDVKKVEMAARPDDAKKETTEKVQLYQIRQKTLTADPDGFTSLPEMGKPVKSFDDTTLPEETPLSEGMKKLAEEITKADVEEHVVKASGTDADGFASLLKTDNSKKKSDDMTLPEETQKFAVKISKDGVDENVLKGSDDKTKIVARTKKGTKGIIKKRDASKEDLPRDASKEDLPRDASKEDLPRGARKVIARPIKTGSPKKERQVKTLKDESEKLAKQTTVVGRLARSRDSKRQVHPAEQQADEQANWLARPDRIRRTWRTTENPDKDVRQKEKAKVEKVKNIPKGGGDISLGKRPIEINVKRERLKGSQLKKIQQNDERMESTKIIPLHKVEKVVQAKKNDQQQRVIDTRPKDEDKKDAEGSVRSAKEGMESIVETKVSIVPSPVASTDKLVEKDQKKTKEKLSLETSVLPSESTEHSVDTKLEALSSKNQTIETLTTEHVPVDTGKKDSELTDEKIKSAVVSKPAEKFEKPPASEIIPQAIADSASSDQLTQLENAKQRETKKEVKLKTDEDGTKESIDEKTPKISVTTEKTSSPRKTTKPRRETEMAVIESQSRYMEWYKLKREEMERKRQDRKDGDEEEVRPKWLRKKTRQRWIKVGPEDRRIFDPQMTETTPSRRRKIKPLVNVESEQLKAIVRQGRKLRRAQGEKADEPQIQIFAPEKPPTPLCSISTSSRYHHHHHLVQHSEYKYEKMPQPSFYLHPPPALNTTSQISQQNFDDFCPEQHYSSLPTDSRCPNENYDPGNVYQQQQVVNKLRHGELLEKKSVFDIAYSEAAPSQLRSDSTTPPS